MVTGIAGTPRSYHVQRIAGEGERNRMHLKETQESFANPRGLPADGEKNKDVV